MTGTPVTVLITGASAGNGEACARAFAAIGARLLLAARRRDRLTALASELRSTAGVEVRELEMDIRDAGVVARVIDELSSQWAGVDVLVNNAGLGRGIDPVQRGDPRDWDEMIDTNIKGLLYVTRAVLPGMLERGRGHVVNIGSIAGREVYPGGAVYCATKAAVDAISRGMRMDLLGTPIRVTNVLPGLVETEFSLVRFRGDAERAEGVYRGYVALTAGDVADAVVYAATRPAHVNVDEVMVKPVAQATTAMVDRREAR
jgi:3-hydroxy acid dehydrogenase/malonic semialdehyde reductase